jgi:hypothetical protein
MTQTQEHDVALARIEPARQLARRSHSTPTENGPAHVPNISHNPHSGY